MSGNKDTMNHERVIFQTDHTIVVAVDHLDPKAGGAAHAYQVRSHDGILLAQIEFQHGPIGEVGVNGTQHVDLLAIIRDRLDCFQRGTCGFVSAALASEDTRTRRRQLIGVEGTSKPG